MYRVYRRLNFSFVPWIRSLFEQLDGGWSVLCIVDTLTCCDQEIAKNKLVVGSTLYEYKVTKDE